MFLALAIGAADHAAMLLSLRSPRSAFMMVGDRRRQPGSPGWRLTARRRLDDRRRLQHVPRHPRRRRRPGRGHPEERSAGLLSTCIGPAAEEHRRRAASSSAARSTRPWCTLARGTGVRTPRLRAIAESAAIRCCSRSTMSPSNSTPVEGNIDDSSPLTVVPAGWPRRHQIAQPRSSAVRHRRRRPAQHDHRVAQQVRGLTSYYDAGGAQLLATLTLVAGRTHGRRHCPSSAWTRSARHYAC